MLFTELPFMTSSDAICSLKEEKPWNSWKSFDHFAAISYISSVIRLS